MIMGGDSTVSIALELMIEPKALVIATEYVPASLVCTFKTVKFVLVAPAIFAPFLLHW
jgi:hypothetical protein